MPRCTPRCSLAALVTTDEELMREYGQQIADATAGEKAA